MVTHFSKTVQEGPSMKDEDFRDLLKHVDHSGFI